MSGWKFQGILRKHPLRHDVRIIEWRPSVENAVAYALEMVGPGGQFSTLGLTAEVRPKPPLISG